jgi:hypothetical protein
MQQIKKYDCAFIYPLVKKVLHGTFSTKHGNELNSRTMMFACQEDLRVFYLVTHEGTEKIKDLEKDPAAALCVLSTSDKLDDYSDTAVVGTCTLLRDFHHPDVQAGFKLLAAKSTTMQLLYNSGNMGEYCMIKMQINKITFRVYRDIILNVPKTIWLF